MQKAKNTTEISPVESADPPKPKSNRGGRRKNQTGRPPSALRLSLSKERYARLYLLASEMGISAEQLAEERLERWLDSGEVFASIAAIERWNRQEGIKKKPPRPKKLPASKIKISR